MKKSQRIHDHFVLASVGDKHLKMRVRTMSIVSEHIRNILGFNYVNTNSLDFTRKDEIKLSPFYKVMVKL